MCVCVCVSVVIDWCINLQTNDEFAKLENQIKSLTTEIHENREKHLSALKAKQAEVEEVYFVSCVCVCVYVCVCVCLRKAWFAI